MQEPTNHLNPQQLAVIGHILAGDTIAKAARRARINRSTIYAWLRHSPDFGAALEHHRSVMAEAAEDRLRELAVEALDALEECIAGPESTPATRFRAAAFILSRRTHPTESNTFSFSAPAVWPAPDILANGSAKDSPV